MKSEKELDDLRFFVIYANNNPEVWKTLVGLRIRHNIFQIGTIEEIVEMAVTRNILIRFDDLPINESLKRFDEYAFKNGYLSLLEISLFQIVGFNDFYTQEKNKEYERMILDQQKEREGKESVKRKKEQERRDAKLLSEIDQLLIKYGIRKLSLTPSIPLYTILKKMESSKPLDEDDNSWLEHNFPALFYELEFHRSNDLWDLIKSCKFWRKERQPHRVIQLLEYKTDRDNKVMSAILTALGAAYRDVNNVEKAEDCANKAIQHNRDSYYPYNLMGAIFYQKGLPEEGDTYFDQAIKLGSSSYLESTIRESLNNAGKEEKIRIVRYLLQKDSLKYKWVAQYLL